MKVKLKSAYLPAGTDDGVRYLVETLWPEGLETQSLSPYQWVHELAPSYDLKEMAIEKHWEPEKFRDEYLRELQEPQRRAWFNRIVKEAEDGVVTLLHRSRIKGSQILPENTSVYYLKEFLEAGVGAGNVREVSGPQTLAARVAGPRSGLNQEVEQWSNEGGR